MGVRRLDQETKRRLEIVVQVEDGSTSFFSDLGPVFNTLVSNMSGAQSLAAIIVAILTTGSLGALYLVLKNRRDLAPHKAQQETISVLNNLSERDAKMLEIVQQLIQQNPPAEKIATGSEKYVKELVGKMEPDDELVVNGETVLNGETGKRLLRKPRSVPLEDRIDGTYLILSVDSGAIKNGIRAKIRSIHDSQELTLLIPEGTLSDKQLHEVQSGEWDKRPLQMQINVTRVEDRITRATLVKAGLANH